jgi:hypothetical protein
MIRFNTHELKAIFWRIGQGESTCTLDASDPRFNLLAGKAAACVQATLVVDVFKRCGSRPSYLII